MELEAIKLKIEQGLNEAEVILSGDGCNCSAIVISNDFSGKGLLEKQKMVIRPVNDLITSGELHALSIKTYTQEEWQKNK